MDSGKAGALAEFAVRQVARWSGYDMVVDTIDDVAKLARALGLVGGIKGVDQRVRHHLSREALALKGTTVWNGAEETVARICQHASIDWRDLVTDLGKVKAGLQQDIDREARNFRSVGQAKHLAKDDPTKPAPQLVFDEPEAAGLLHAFVDAGLRVLQEEAINRKDFLTKASVEGLKDHDRLEESIDQVHQRRQGPAGRLADRYRPARSMKRRRGGRQPNGVHGGCPDDFVELETGTEAAFSNLKRVGSLIDRRHPAS